MLRNGLLPAVALMLACAACDGANPPSSTQAAAPNQTVQLGAFTVNVPSAWTPWKADELRALRKSYEGQLEEMYRQFNNGSPMPGNTLELVAFHTPSGSEFLGVLMRIPPQADLMGQLKDEAPRKVKWGIEKGFIKSASEVKPIARDNFDGFCMDMESTKGTHDFMGGLVHSTRKTEIIQVSLMAGAKEEKPAETFTTILASVTLPGAPPVPASTTHSATPPSAGATTQPASSRDK